MRIEIDGECERSCAELEIETNVKGQRVGKIKKEAKGVKGENPKMKSQNVSGYFESQTWRRRKIILPFVDRASCNDSCE